MASTKTCNTPGTAGRKYTRRVQAIIRAHPLIALFGTAAIAQLAIIPSAAAVTHQAGLPTEIALVFAALIMIPASEVALQVARLAMRLFLRARLLPKLELFQGIPDPCRTILVVPALLSSESTVLRLVARLERDHLAQFDRNLHLALLLDFVDADQEHLPQDQILLDLARSGVASLERRYGGKSGSHFLLLHRHRRWNACQGKWIGWERKRGKLEDFTRLLRGARDTGFLELVGDVASLGRVRYVITVDEDTEIPPGAVRRLVATIAHPLNQPVVDAAARRVVRGYGVIQPHMRATRESADRSLFARVSTRSSGLHPESPRRSDLYQDLLDESEYVGKGIYDVDTFVAVVAGRVPENHLLSHDLFEGTLLRSGAASDIELREEFPSAYRAFAQRQHRWIRGDWQVTPWLLPRPVVQGWRVGDIPARGWWFLVDPVRSSLVDPALLALLIAGWTLPLDAAAACTMLGLGLQSFPILAGALNAWIAAASTDDSGTANVPGTGVRSAVLCATQMLLALAMLPDSAMVSADAIVRTLVRLCITRRNLLEWRTSSQSQTGAGYPGITSWLARWSGPVLALAALAHAALADLRSTVLVLPIAVLWLAAPVVADWISRPLTAGVDKPAKAAIRQAVP